MLQAILDFASIRHGQFIARQQQGGTQQRLFQFGQQGQRHRMIRHPDSYGATPLILEPFGGFARRQQDERIGPRGMRLEQPIVLVAHLGVGGDLRQIAANQREMVVFVGGANTRNPLQRVLVADMAAQRVAGISGINDHPAVTDDPCRLLNQAWLGIFGVNF